MDASCWTLIPKGPKDLQAWAQEKLETDKRTVTNFPSFLKPLDGGKKQSAMAAGTANEGNVLDALPAFLNRRADCGMKMGSRPKEMGLIAQQNKQHLATSMDGLSTDLEVRANTEDGGTWTSPVAASVEVETIVSKDSMKEMEKAIAAVDTTGGGVMHCTFGDQTFKKIMSNTGCRVQVLHHATVAQPQTMSCLLLPMLERLGSVFWWKCQSEATRCAKHFLTSK